MTIVVPVPIPAAPAVPDSSVAEPTFDAQYEAFNGYEKNTLVPGMNALAAATYANAQDAKASAEASTGAIGAAADAQASKVAAAASQAAAGASAASAGASATTATSAKDAAVAAKDTAVAAAGTAAGAATDAQASKTAAAASQAAAGASAASAGTSATTATSAKDAAVTAKDTAVAAAGTATDAATSADTSAKSAGALNQGGGLTPPTTDAWGRPLTVGATFYSTVPNNKKWLVWSGSAWVEGLTPTPTNGDMQKSVYDTNNSGVVDAAESVPWVGVQNKPTTLSGYGITDADIRLAPEVKSVAFTAANGGVYLCNTSASAFAMTLPAAPQPGWIVTVYDYASAFDLNNLTALRNGKNILGQADNYVLDQKNRGRTFRYADNTKGWVVS